MSSYNVEYHDDDQLAFVTFDNGKKATVRFSNNRITIEPDQETNLGVDEVMDKILIVVS